MIAKIRKYKLKIIRIKIIATWIIEEEISKMKEDSEFTLPQEHIQHTCAGGDILTENHLDANRKTLLQLRL